MANDAAQILQWARHRQREWLLKDFYTFAKHSNICPDIDEIPYRSICNYLESLIPNTPNIAKWRAKTGRKPLRGKWVHLLALFLLPRLTFKSSLASALCIYAIILDPDMRIVLCRATITDAKHTLYGIKTHIESNAILRSAFADSFQFDRWTDVSITLSNRKPGLREPTIDTTGLDTSKVGSHPDFVIVDDIVHEKNYQSVIEMENAKVKIQSFYPILERWGSLLCIGTRWSDIDCYGWILDQEERREQGGKPRRWETSIHSCWKDGEPGVPMFPTVLPVAKIDDLRENTTPKLFAVWYLNVARSEGEDIFTLSYIQYFTIGEFYGGPFPELELDPNAEDNKWLIEKFGSRIRLSTVMLIDPAPTVATSARTSDATGIVIVGFDIFRNWWVLSGEAIKKLPTARLDHVLNLARTYTPALAALENGDIGVPMLEDRLRRNGIRCKVVSFDPRMDRRRMLSDPKLAPRGFTKKAAQIENLEPVLKARRVLFARGTTTELVNQICKYPHLIHDDALDAFSMTPAYESFQETQVDDNPERIFREIERREYQLEGLDDNGDELPDPDAPLQRGGGKLPWSVERDILRRAV